MYISEAAKLAAEQGRLMVRKSIISKSDTVFGAVQPTNSYERCKLIVFKEDETRSCRCWNPTQADLVADDWVQFTTPSGLHSVLERPFSEANGRPFLVKRSPLIVC